MDELCLPSKPQARPGLWRDNSNTYPVSSPIASRRSESDVSEARASHRNFSKTRTSTKQLFDSSKKLDCSLSDLLNLISSKRIFPLDEDTTIDGAVQHAREKKHKRTRIKVTKRKTKENQQKRPAQDGYDPRTAEVIARILTEIKTPVRSPVSKNSRRAQYQNSSASPLNSLVSPLTVDSDLRSPSSMLQSTSPTKRKHHIRLTFDFDPPFNNFEQCAERSDFQGKEGVLPKHNITEETRNVVEDQFVRENDLKQMSRTGKRQSRDLPPKLPSRRQSPY